MSIWDSEVELGEVTKSNKEKIIIKKVTKSGKGFIDVRVYYKDGEDYKPSPKGVAIPQSKVNEVIDLFKAGEAIDSLMNSDVNLLGGGEIQDD